jgi:diaminopimelate epimerase
MHGLGNDFVILDGRVAPIAMTGPLARALADRRTGVGCDQLILLSNSETADLRMDIWNADGGKAEACGNAFRCVVKLADVESIETDGGIIHGSPGADEVEVVLQPPSFEWAAIPLAYAMDTAALPLAWDEYRHPAAVNVGNPHLVFFMGATDEERLREVGPVIEHDPAFPQRINVNIAVPEADGSLTLRTWERGAGLTLACGTGACATAVAAIRAKKAVSPVTVRMKGGDLTIDWSEGQPIKMRGAATHLFEGRLNLADFV